MVGGKVMKVLKALLLAAGVVALNGCGASAADEGTAEVGQVREALAPVVPGTRPNIHSLTSQQRTSLVNGILAFITQPILDEHAAAHEWHHPSNGENFFIRHHEYLNKLETYLTNNGLSQFVPLPEWDPGTSIPSEFFVVDPLVSSSPLLNQNPNRPLPAAFNDLCSFPSASQLAIQLETFHDGVHDAIKGAMASIAQAPGAPIFWLWHGFLDDQYHEYEARCENRKDFNRDVHTDVLWHNGSTGQVGPWWMDGTTVLGNSFVNWTAPSSSGWEIKGTGDFTGDGRTDILWHNPESGLVNVWALDGMNVTSNPSFAWMVPASSGWELKGTGDFNRDGHIDLLWYNGGTGQIGLWYLNGMTILGTANLSWTVWGNEGWEIKGTGDFNRDGQMDVLWYRPSTGEVSAWLMNGTDVSSNPVVGVNVPGDQGWNLMGTGDYNRDGNIDLLWHHPDSGTVLVWFLGDDGTTIAGTANLSWSSPGTTWQIVSR
jgi:hypothetical protein